MTHPTPSALTPPATVHGSVGHACEPDPNLKKLTPVEPSKPRAKRRVMTPVCVIGQGEITDFIAQTLASRRPRRYDVERVDAPDQPRLGDHSLTAALQTPQEHLAILVPAEGDAATTTLEQVQRLTAGEHPPLVLVALAEPRHTEALPLIRGGATDVLLGADQAERVNDRVDAAARRLEVHRHARLNEQRLRHRVRRLTRSCRDSQDQLDRLSEDLVAAYQNLAGQMQHVVQSTQYSALVKSELDLEQLLRKTLEHLVERAGPTNAAVFLPAVGDEYALGGYVNYDCPDDAADMLLNHLADVLAPRVAEHEGTVHVSDDATLVKWLGDDAAWLGDSHVIGFTAKHDGEPLAVVSLFRDADQPFPADLLTAVAAIAPLMGETLARLIRVHHRGGHIEEGPAYDEPAWA